jgi:hypothetical protein
MQLQSNYARVFCATRMQGPEMPRKKRKAGAKAPALLSDEEGGEPEIVNFRLLASPF